MGRQALLTGSWGVVFPKHVIFPLRGVQYDQVREVVESMGLKRKDWVT